MEIEDIPVDLSTKEGVKRTIGALTSEIKRLHDSKASQADIEAASEKAAEDLRKALRAQNELALSDHQRHSPSGSEVEVQRYLPMKGDDIEAAHRGTYLKSESGAVQVVAREFADGGYAPGLLDDTPRTEWQAELQELATKRRMVRAMQKTPHTPSLDRQIARHMAVGPQSIRRIFADTTGIGAEWIPDNWSSMLERDLYAPRAVASLFPEMVIPAGGTFKLPYLSSRLTPYIAAPPTADDPAQFRKTSLGTAERTIDPKKFTIFAQIDEDASEDSLIAVEPELRREMALAFGDAYEDAIINGDLAGTRDTALATWNPRSRWSTAALGIVGVDHRTAFDGLRERALDSAAANNAADRSAATDFDGFRGDLATLNAAHWMGGQASIVCIPTPEYYLKTMLGFTEVVTLDKLGSAATVLTGQLASLAGYPIILSEFMTADLNATGIYDGVTETKGGMLLVSTSRFRRYRRRGERVRLSQDITRGVINVVADWRGLWKTHAPATEKNVRYAYNLPT